MSTANCLIASKNGRDSMSPTVPPISTKVISLPSQPNKILSLIALG